LCGDNSLAGFNVEDRNEVGLIEGLSSALLIVLSMKKEL